MSNVKTRPHYDPIISNVKCEDTTPIKRPPLNDPIISHYLDFLLRPDPLITSIRLFTERPKFFAIKLKCSSA